MFVLVEGPFGIDFIIGIFGPFPELIPVVLLFKEFLKLAVGKEIKEGIDGTVGITFPITLILVEPEVVLGSSAQVIVIGILHSPNDFGISSRDHLIEARPVFFTRHQSAVVVIDLFGFGIRALPVLHHQINTGQDSGSDFLIDKPFFSRFITLKQRLGIGQVGDDLGIDLFYRGETLMGIIAR